MQHAAMLSTRRAKQKHTKALAKAARDAKKAGKASPKTATRPAKKATA